MNTDFLPATGRHHLYRSEFAFHCNCQITEPLLFHRRLNGLDFSDKSTQVHSPVGLLMKQSVDRSIEGSVIPECVYLSTALFWQLSLLKIMQPCIEQGTWEKAGIMFRIIIWAEPLCDHSFIYHSLIWNVSYTWELPLLLIVYPLNIFTNCFLVMSLVTVILSLSLHVNVRSPLRKRGQSQLGFPVKMKDKHDKSVLWHYTGFTSANTKHTPQDEILEETNH